MARDLSATFDLSRLPVFFSSGTDLEVFEAFFFSMLLFKFKSEYEFIARRVINFLNKSVTDLIKLNSDKEGLKMNLEID